mmetsp:Transcript_52233/g.124539  ORF Transcript_52233/g.124539 Transcript_52233/m.124539 type:complete len:245 (+) Transcript_52233:87-821(+)
MQSLYDNLDTIFNGDGDDEEATHAGGLTTTWVVDEYAAYPQRPVMTQYHQQPPQSTVFPGGSCNFASALPMGGPPGRTQAPTGYAGHMPAPQMPTGYAGHMASPPMPSKQEPTRSRGSNHIIHEPVIPVKVRIERVAQPRPEYKEFPHHDPAYGPWFRSNQPDRDGRDKDFLEVEPDVEQPLGWLWSRHKSAEIAEKRQKQWESQFQEMRHPKVEGLFRQDHAPATVCYQNKFDGHSLMSWLAA